MPDTTAARFGRALLTVSLHDTEHRHKRTSASNEKTCVLHNPKLWASMCRMPCPADRRQHRCCRQPPPSRPIPAVTGTHGSMRRQRRLPVRTKVYSQPSVMQGIHFFIGGWRPPRLVTGTASRSRRFMSDMGGRIPVRRVGPCPVARSRAAWRQIVHGHRQFRKPDHLDYHGKPWPTSSLPARMRGRYR